MAKERLKLWRNERAYYRLDHIREGSEDFTLVGAYARKVPSGYVLFEKDFPTIPGGESFVFDCSFDIGDAHRKLYKHMRELAEEEASKRKYPLEILIEKLPIIEN